MPRIFSRSMTAPNLPWTQEWNSSSSWSEGLAACLEELLLPSCSRTGWCPTAAIRPRRRERSRYGPGSSGKAHYCCLELQKESFNDNVAVVKMNFVGQQQESGSNHGCSLLLRREKHIRRNATVPINMFTDSIMWCKVLTGSCKPPKLHNPDPNSHYPQRTHISCGTIWPKTFFGPHTSSWFHAGRAPCWAHLW